MTSTAVVPAEFSDSDVQNDVDVAVRSLRAGAESDIVCSFKVDTPAEKIALLQAITAPESVEDHLGEVIALRNFVAQPISITNEVTGEVSRAPRIILIADDGTAYACVSSGMLKALETLVAVCGQPSTWSGPMWVSPVAQKAKVGRFFTLNYVEPPKK